MFVVAIHRLQGNEELLARELGALLGKTVAEARGRVRVAASGPAVVGTFAHPEAAGTLVGALVRHGFDTLELSPAEVAAAGQWREVTRVSLAAEGVVAQVGNQVAELPYGQLDLILSGSATDIQRESVVVRERHFSPTRALLTGGLLLHARTARRKVIEHEKRERFVLLQPASGLPPLVLREGALAYGEIGVPRAASSAGNLGLLAAELRQRCPQAGYDDRLESRMVQRLILGTLDPHRHLEIAIALVMRCLRDARPATVS